MRLVLELLATADGRVEDQSTRHHPTSRCRTPAGSSIYRLAVTATDRKGTSCTKVLTVAVPHNQKATAIDSGGELNSLA